MSLSSWIVTWKSSLERRWALHQALRRQSFARRRAVRPHVEALEDRCLLSTYVVKSGGDTNTSGTLRFGINQANNASNGITEIDFNITGGGAQTITLTSQLPTLTTGGVYINGLSEGGTGNTTPLITLNGTNAGSSSDGLLITGKSNTVSGLILEDFGKNGIEVNGASNIIGGTTAGAGNILLNNTNAGLQIDTNISGVQVLGNYIGTNVSGTSTLGNGIGVLVEGTNDTIGGTTAGARNIISANKGDGVDLASSAGTLIEGNYIGTDATGSVAIANSIGIVVNGSSATVGGTSSSARNIISANSSYGLSILTAGTLVEGNFIGTDVTGSKAIGNGTGVLVLFTSGGTIGGTVSGAGNLISGNSGGDGLYLDSASGEFVFGNLIGTDVTGAKALGNRTGIEIDASGNTIGGTTSAARNFISGNTGDGVLIDGGISGNQVLGNYIGTNVAGTGALANNVGFQDAGTGNTLGGSVNGAKNVISGNKAQGVLIDNNASDETVQGNYIGLSSSGKAALANSGSGIVILQGNNNTIGGNSGSDYFTRNFISGNGNNGLEIDFGSGNQVLGNFIGVDISGTNGLGNVANGVYVDATGNTIGGTVSGLGNTISGNSNDGMLFDSGASGNLALGNDVGTDYTSSKAVANLSNGIEIDGSGNTVGGTVSAARNIISGNDDQGVLIQSGASGNLVQGNYLGLNAAGAALGNSIIGIAIDGNVNTVGGTASAARNIISGNGDVGVYIGASGNVVLGNYVGLDPSGSSARSNGYGFEILASNNTVGGTASTARNIISGNAVVGVYVGSGVSGNQVLGNYIGSNTAGTGAVSNRVGIEDYGSGNTLGGSVSGARNVISGNGGDGVLLGSSSSDETVQSNYIGLSSSGKAALANSSNGVEVSGNNNTIGGNSGSSSLVRNYISGNGSDGVLIDSGATGNQVLGDFIGLDISGTNGLGNVGNGVEVAGNGNTIGGTVSGLGNTISGSGLDGLLIDSGATGNLVAGDSVGTDYTSKLAVANSGNGIEVAGNSNTLGGTASAARNIVAGNRKDGVLLDNSATGILVEGNYIGVNASGAALANGTNGIEIATDKNTIGGTVSAASNLISGNTSDGVLIDSSATGNQVQGNYIGLNASGTAVANLSGVEIAGSSNTIGGTASAARNIISANTKDGVKIDGSSSGNQVLGNYIGTNVAGTAALANNVGIEDAGIGNTLGGSVNGAKNVISGNKAQGVLIDNNASDETVQGNYIGLSSSGKAALANSGSGVVILQGNNNTIGGNSASDYFTRNFITGNGNNGLEIDFGSGNQVQGNFIGVDISGTNGLGNVGNDVEIFGNGNTIGGTVTGLGNTISGSGEDGVLIWSGASGNLVMGNDVGTDYTGKIAVTNSSSGIEIDGSGNTVGGTVSAARNIISGNDIFGVLIQSGASGNLVQGNYLGLNAAGAALGNSIYGIAIVSGNGNTVGGTASAARNIISANDVGVYLGDSGNLVLGNYVGLDPSGSVAMGNSTGIEILASNNTVGGTASAARNIISGNAFVGVYVGSGVSGNQVLGNYIGTNAAGTGAVSNGVGIEDYGSGNTLGGSVSGARNVISGNGGDGVLLGSSSSDETVQSNYIGLSSSGKAILTNGSNGVEVQGVKNTIGGNSSSNYYTRNFITGNGGDGVLIDSGATGNVVEGNFIGIDISGTNGLGNVGNGVEIAGNGNTIGGTISGLGNTISGNSNDGVLIDSTATGNLVVGNDVGTDYTGNNAVANGGNGVEVMGVGNTLGGTASGSRNIISGNFNDGVLLASASSGDQVLGNYVGTNASGSAGIGNGTGIEVAGSNNTIGGTASGARNIISGNNGVLPGSADGMLFDSIASGNQVLGNYIGLNAAGNALGNFANGIEVAGSNNTLGGTSSVARNIISANGSDGVLLDNGATGNQVLGNYIGTNVGGTASLANFDGVEVEGSSNTIGGSIAGARNVISGNIVAGILLDIGNSGNAVQGNFIGLNASGTAALANDEVGVWVESVANTIGGTVLSARNYISGNGDFGVNAGIYFDSGAVGNLVLGNFIGIDISGTHGVGNLANGVEIAGNNNTVGGTASGAGNVISANGNDGVLLYSTATGNLVLGDYLGTDYTGRNALGNSGNGIEVATRDNTLGGTTSAARNIISGNGINGILIDSGASVTLVQGDYIGLNPSGAALGNSGYGVSIAGNNNAIGGSVSGAGNSIAYNNNGGVLLSAGSGNTVSRNSIFANGNTQTGDGICFNNGANNNLAAPSLNSATLNGTTLTVTGTFNATTANVPYVLEFFGNPVGDAEGKLFVGSLSLTPTSTGTQSFTFTTTTSLTGSNPFVASTLTDASGDVSGFSTATMQATAIGPAPIVNGQTAGNLAVSGRVTGVAPDPKNANIIYIAAAGGGIWKTINGGATWSPLTDNLTDSSGNPLPEFMGAVAETDATSGTFNGNQIVYAGMGEANNSNDALSTQFIFSNDTYYGEGILVSTNGGATWTLENAAGAFTGRTVSKIVIDPSDTTGATAYAAVAGNGVNGQSGNTGIWKTTNFGQTWTNTTAANGLSTTDTWSDVAIDPHTPTTLYAAEANPQGAAGNGVYKSINGGTTWTLLSGAGTANGSQDGRISLALFDNGATNELFVSIAQPIDTGGALLKLLESTNGGTSFTDLTANVSNYLSGQGGYDNTVVVDPQNSSYIYVGGAATNQGPTTFSGSPLESFNGGATWVDIATDPAGNGLHSDDHTAAFDAAGNLIDGDDGGVFKLTNPTSQTNQRWSSLNTNLQITQFTGVAADPTVSNLVYGGSQDNGTQKTTGLVGWSHIYDGDGGIVRVDPTNHNIVYTERFGVSLAVSTNGGATFTSNSSGISWNFTNFYNPYVLDSSGNIYFGADFLNFSSNHGSSWTTLAQPGLNNFNSADAAINAIAVSPTNNNTVYVSVGGNIFVSQNAQLGAINATWTQINLPGGAKAGALNSLAIDPADLMGGTAYAVVNSFTGGSSGHVFKTTNFGSTWTDISGNLPNTPVDSVTVSPDGGTVFVGTDVGVYTTSDGGTTWTRFDPALPNAQVVELEIVPSQNILLVGTHGRGAWEVALPPFPSITPVGSIGPGPIVTGQIAGSGPVSGRITGVASDPKNANIVYIAAAGGGIWKSTNATSGNPTWIPLTDNLTDSNGNSIPDFMGAVAETDDSNGNQIVYAGTGEADNSADSYYGEGILVSRNGGSTWTLTNANGAFSGKTVSKIALDPSDSTGGTAYAAVSGFGVNGTGGNTGIWKTTNFGQTWTNLTGAVGLSTTDAWSDVVVDPHTPSTVYAAEGTDIGASGNGVYKSTNGGSTWALLTNCPNGTSDGRISLALYDDGATNELLVSISNPTNFGLYKMEKSTNGGSTFTDLTSNPGLTNYLNIQGWYDTTLAIDPTNANYIYAGGEMSTFGPTFSGSPLESFDGGNTWHDISTDSKGNGPHTDAHAAAFDANGNLLEGDDGGIFRLNNPTDSATQTWSDLNTNLQITQFYGVAADPVVKNVVYGGSQDNGTVKYSGALGWTQLAGGDGGITRVDPANHLRVYQEFQLENLEVSTDGGSTFKLITNGIAGSKNDFIAPYVLDASGNIYYGTDYLNFSNNQGSSWSQIGTPNTHGFNPNDAAIDSIAVNPVLNSNVVYVSAGGKMFVTKNAQAGGNNVIWTEIDLPGGARSGTVGITNTLAVSPADSTGGTAYAVVNSFTGGSSGHVFKTTNFGATWTDISGNLPNTPVDSVAVSPGGGTIFVGTDVGVYSTINGGTTWTRFDATLPNAQVVELEIVPSQNVLLVGTHGRGAWEVPLPSPLPAPSPINQAAQAMTADHAITVAHTLTPTPSSSQFPQTTNGLAATETPQGLGNALAATHTVSSLLAGGGGNNVAIPSLSSARLNGSTLTLQGSYMDPAADAWGLASVAAMWQQADALDLQRLDALMSLEAGAMGVTKDILMRNFLFSSLSSPNDV